MEFFGLSHEVQRRAREIVSQILLSRLAIFLFSPQTVENKFTTT